MKPHEERVIAEYQELEKKATALRAFLDCEDVPYPPGVTREEIARMEAQWHAMQVYLGILNLRIGEFSAAEV